MLLDDEDAPDDVREQAEELGAQIDEDMARLTIEVQGPRRGAEVTLDGQPVSEAVIGVASPIDPGRHVVRLSRDGEALDVEEAQLSRGADATVTLQAPPSATDAAVAASLEDTGEQGDGNAGWWIGTSVGVVVAAGVVAAVLLVLRPGDESPTQGDFMPGRIEVTP